MTRRVIVVGLSGATFDLIEPWAAEGHLPNLARILREGAFAPLQSALPPALAPAWSSFNTGVNPERHGIYDRIARVPGGYRFAPVTAADCRAPTFYDHLSRAGKRVLLLNVPMTWPPPALNGYVIAGLPAPSLDANIGNPPEALDEARRAAGDYLLYPEPGDVDSARGVTSFLDQLYRCTVLRITAFEHLRNSEPWDFAMIAFNGVEAVSRATWKYMDPAHPLHDPAAPAAFQTAIRDQYLGMDRYIGRLMEIMGEETAIVVMSEHGMGPMHTRLHINRWLIEQGFMQLRARRGLRCVGAMRLDSDVDWAHTVAYAPGDAGQIHLNLAGREPQGIVQPHDYARTLDEIMARLIAWRDPANGGTPVVEALSAGANLPDSPAIVFQPRAGYGSVGGLAPGAGQAIEPVRRGFTAAPRPEGVFMAWGPGVKPAAGLPSAHITDLAPTLLHLLDQPISDDLVGRALI